MRHVLQALEGGPRTLDEVVAVYEVGHRDALRYLTGCLYTGHVSHDDGTWTLTESGREFLRWYLGPGHR